MNESNHEHDERESSPEIADLLRRSLERDEPRPRNLLPGIQERIRVHTRGRYFRNRENPLKSPILFLLASACFVLVLAAALYLTLGSLFSVKPSKSHRETGSVPAARDIQRK